MSSTRERNKRQALQSLIIIAFIYIVGWFNALSVYSVLLAISAHRVPFTSNCLITEVDATIVFYVAAYNGLALLFSFSTNPIIYFWRCKLYRTEMRRVLGLMKTAFMTTTQQYTAQHNCQVTTQF